MAEHSASVTIGAPAHQVYELFTHFNDFPKFMTFVKEVTYTDSQNSHWVADIVGRHEWDAVNENVIPDRQIGWRSTDGLENSGRVMFSPTGESRTQVTVLVGYNPPAGFLGDIAEALGSGKHFETALQHDLENFAKMVAEAPPGALDPMSSDYLFHEESAAAKGQTTERQNDSMTTAASMQAAGGDNSSQTTPADLGYGPPGPGPASASGYNTDTSEADPDSAPTTGTANWAGEQSMGSKADGETTVGNAAAVANQNDPITAKRQEEAMGTENPAVLPVDDDA